MLENTIKDPELGGVSTTAMPLHNVVLRDVVTELSFDLRFLRLILTAMDKETTSSISKLELMAMATLSNAPEHNAGVVTSEFLIKTFMFLRGRVTRAIRQLCCTCLGLSGNIANGNGEEHTSFFAASREWEDFLVLSNAIDALVTCRLALIEKLGNVITHLEVFLKECAAQDDRASVFAEKVTALHSLKTRNNNDNVVETAGAFAPSFGEKCNDGKKAPCATWSISSSAVNNFFGPHIGQFFLSPSLCVLFALFSVITALMSGSLLLDYKLLNNANDAFSFQTNFAFVGSSCLIWKLIHLFIFVLQLILIIIIGAILFITQIGKGSNFSNLEAFWKLFAEWILFLRAVNFVKNDSLNNSACNDNNDKFRDADSIPGGVNGGGVCVSLSSADCVVTDDVKSAALLSQNAKKIIPNTSLGNGDDDLSDSKAVNTCYCKTSIHDNKMKTFLVSKSNEPMDIFCCEVSKAQNNQKETKEEKCRNCFLYKEVTTIKYPQCIQAKQEVKKLISEIQTGVADKQNDAFPFVYTDRTAKFCRHIVENVQDCVCPLVILECAHNVMMRRGSYKANKNTNTFPLVYCNFTALELLQYRWLAEIAGKDFRNIFCLYRSVKRASSKKQTAGAKPSVLPVLSQARQRKVQSRLFIVPSPPPPKEQKTVEKRRRLEEISDPHCLFENGVEEELTLFATQKSLCFDVYAMSVDRVVLPSSFCDTVESNTQHSADKSYLVLVLLRQVTNKTDIDNISATQTNRVCCEDSLKRTNQYCSPIRKDFDGPSHRRASSASTSIFNSLAFQESLENGEANPSFSLRVNTSNQRRRSTKTVTPPRRSKRRSTVKGFCSPVSAERGRTVDQITARQLQEKLDGFKTVSNVEISPRVPDSFLVNFVAIMIFVNRILRRYKRVKCRVDAENMYILLEIKEDQKFSVIKNSEQSSKEGGGNISPLREVILSDGGTKTSGISDSCSSAFFSPNLMEYLSVCDASIMFSHDGCILKFPYTTQERLALMEAVGSLQFSTNRGLSLFGVAATNALTEGLEKVNGQMIYLDQYASAEKAFSEAMNKAYCLPSPLVDKNKSSSSPFNSEVTLKPDQTPVVSFFGAVQSQSMEEIAATSSTDSLCLLPSVVSGGLPRGWELGTSTPPFTRDSRSFSDVNPMLFESPCASLGARGDNVFGKPGPRSGSDAMATSITSTGLNVVSLRKRYLHVFLYIKEYRADVTQYLWARGHSATVVCEAAVMKRYLLIGLHIFDVVFVEWTEKLITPDIRDLIAAAAGKQATILYLLNEDTYTLPLPPGTPDEAVLRMHNIVEIFNDPLIGHSISLYIQQRQLRNEMAQIRWLKNYQIVRRLGGGAFGDVYEVYFFISRGRLAMKRVFFSGASNRILEQLNREVLIMSQLDHPNIVSFSHSSMEDHAYCIFMELCDETLSQRLQQASVASQSNRNNNNHQQQQQQRLNVERELAPLSAAVAFSVSPVARYSKKPNFDNGNINKIQEPLTPREVVLLLHDIASGIAYIHSRGIVHRDIKPCNILFCSGVAKIGDFGSAAEENAKKPLVNMKGTLAYMSPEVLLGEPYGKPCDMWSFGCLVAETIGLRLGHLQGLHVPALMELYKYIPKTGSLPITVANYKASKLQRHCDISTIQLILNSMKTAFDENCREKRENNNNEEEKEGGGGVTSHGGGGGGGTSTSWKEKSTTSLHEDVDDVNLQSSVCCDAEREVVCFSTNSNTFIGVDKVKLPQSLVELLENLFHRDPLKRMTADEVLQHPVTWNVEWMDMAIRAVEDIYALEQDDTMTDATPGRESSAGAKSDLDLSITSC